MATTVEGQPELRQAIENAVDLVNSHSGSTAIHLEFNAALPPLEFIANSGSFQGDRFVFTAGFETYAGNLDQLRSIRADVIGH